MTYQQLEVKVRVTNFVKQYICNDQDLEDVLQEVWISLYLAYPSYQEHGHLIAWALKIAYHECNNFFRSRTKEIKKVNELREILSESLAGEINPHLIEKEVVFSYLYKLSKKTNLDRDMKILHAYFLDFKNIMCISREQNISRKVVTRIINHAKLDLRDEFYTIFDDSYQCIDKLNIVKN